MEILKEIVIGTLSNCLWVVLVFAILYVRDRKKREQIENCLVANLTYLIKSVAMVRYTLYPYIHLVNLKATEGTILATLLKTIYELTASLMKQTQEGLSLVESRKIQEKLLRLHQRITIFQAHVSESQVAVDIIVGNPTELVEEPRKTQEIRNFCGFERDFHRMVQEIREAFPAKIRDAVPSEIADLMNYETPLYREYKDLQI